MRRALALSALAVGLLAAAPAQAAQLAVAPTKPCYHSGETVALAGGGFTPNKTVTVSADGSSIGSDSTDGTGVFTTGLKVALASGERVKTYVAKDNVNPSITASIPLRVSAVAVKLRPQNGKPGRRIRIRARGFTTGKNLYVHVVRRKGGFRRNRKIGRLKGACHTLRKRKRLLPRRPPEGTYTVQFDSRRRYKRTAKVKARFKVTIRRFLVPARASGARASAASTTWQRIP